MDTLIMITIGFAAGFLGSTSGTGGGTLMVPGLILLLKQPYRQAVGISLAAMVPIAAVAAWRHATEGRFNLPMALTLAIGGIFGAWIGVILLKYIPEVWVKRAFSILLIYTAARLW